LSHRQGSAEPPPPGPATGQQLELGPQYRRLVARDHLGRSSIRQGDQWLVDAPIGDPELIAERLDGDFERPHVHLIGAVRVPAHVIAVDRRSRLNISIIGHQNHRLVAIRVRRSLCSPAAHPARDRSASVLESHRPRFPPETQPAHTPVQAEQAGLLASALLRWGKARRRSSGYTSLAPAAIIGQRSRALTSSVVLCLGAEAATERESRDRERVSPSPAAPAPAPALPPYRQGGICPILDRCCRWRRPSRRSLPRFQRGGVVPIAAHAGEMVLPANISTGLQRLFAGAQGALLFAP